MRRIAAWLALSACVATWCGLPCAAPARSGPAYPCQGHACGCASAAQCWSACCCYTPAERRAWARLQDVEPPAELTAADEAPQGCCTSPATSRNAPPAPGHSLPEMSPDVNTAPAFLALRCAGRGAWGGPVFLMAFPTVLEAAFPQAESGRVAALPQPALTSCCLEISPPPPRRVACVPTTA